MTKAADGELVTVPGLPSPPPAPEAEPEIGPEPTAAPEPPPTPGRVLLLVDALCGGAAETFVTRCFDLGIGRILSTSHRPGGEGGITLPVDLDVQPPDGPGSGLDVRIARPIRSGPRASGPFVPHYVRARTPTDVHSQDHDLLAFAAECLREDWSD